MRPSIGLISTFEYTPIYRGVRHRYSKSNHSLQREWTNKQKNHSSNFLSSKSPLEPQHQLYENVYTFSTKKRNSWLHWRWTWKFLETAGTKATFSCHTVSTPGCGKPYASWKHENWDNTKVDAAEKGCRQIVGVQKKRSLVDDFFATSGINPNF